MAGNAFYAFGEGFLNGLKGQMDANAQERKAARAQLVERYGTAVEQYRASRAQAAQTLSAEEMFKQMGIPAQIAALAAYEGVKPGEVGAYARRFAVTSAGVVQDTESGEQIDVPKLTGQVPETPLPAQGSTNPALAQESATAGTPAPQAQPLPASGAPLEPQTAGDLGYAMPQDNRGFMGRVLGAPDMGADSAYAIKQIANMYGVDPQDILAAINSPQTQPMPDVSGVRAKSDIELALEEKSAGLRGGDGSGGSENRPDSYSSTSGMRYINALYGDLESDGMGGFIMPNDPEVQQRTSSAIESQYTYNSVFGDAHHNADDTLGRWLIDVNNTAAQYGLPKDVAVEVVRSAATIAQQSGDYEGAKIASAAEAKRQLDAAAGSQPTEE